MKKLLTTVDLILAVFCISGALATIEHLELVMQRYAVKGGDVILHCNHSVPLEQLHKVEWRKQDKKIFQYVKGRSPPFRFFPTEGFEFSKANSSEKQLHLSKLDYAASGWYSCVVSMETPIFSKDSESRMLTVIEPQDYDPEITFNKETYEIGEILEVNCTTAPSRPPPHITWFINDEKVDDSLTKSFSDGWTHKKNYFEHKGPSTKQLSIEVSELHVGDDGELRLTCMSTIPGYIIHSEDYGDMRKRSVKIDIVMTENPAEPISNNELSSCGRLIHCYFVTTVFSLFLLLF